MTAKQSITCSLWCIACLLSVSTTTNGQVVQAVARGDQLETFLIENRLTRLLLTHQEVQAEGGANDRDEALDQLQVSYARALFGQLTDETWSQNLMEKAKSSLAVNPNRKSERLRLAVSHRAVELLLRDHLLGNKLASADVDRIIDEINLIQRGVKQQVENLDRLTELKQSEIGDRGLLDQLRQQMRHGEYLLGWCHFLKSAVRGHQNKPVLRDAESNFRSFLGLDPHANLTKFSAGQFGQQSRFQIMATVGLAVVMRGIGSDKQADHCFEVAEANARQDSKEEREIETIHQWKFTEYFYAGNRIQATAMIDENSELLRSKMCIGVILSRLNVDDELVEKGLMGLTLNFESVQLREALSTFPNAIAKDDFPGHWMRGYLALNEFQKTEEATLLQLATSELNEAIKKLEPRVPIEVRGHCRFLLGSCWYLSENYQNAAQEFLRASELLRSSDTFYDDERALAAEAAYRALQSVRLIPGDQEASAKDIANWLNANFPASPFAELANFDVDLGRLDSVSDNEAIDYLSRIRKNKSSVPVHSAVSTELAKRYSLSQDLPIETFRNYVETIQRDDRVTADTKIQTSYQYVSKLLAQPNPLDFEAEIDAAFVKVRELIEGSPATIQKRSKAAKLLYFEAFALRTLQPKNHTRAFEHFQTLEAMNDLSQWTPAATVEIAKVFENAEKRENTDEKQFRGNMIAVYKFLLSQRKSVKSVNREIALQKLATLYLANDQILEAESLAENSKQNPLWLPIQASLAEKRNDLSGSAYLWQQVESQQTQGIDVWLDARLSRLLVLHQLDENAATELLSRTLTLNPNMPQTYATRFRQLADQWGMQ